MRELTISATLKNYHIIKCPYTIDCNCVYVYQHFSTSQWLLCMCLNFVFTSHFLRHLFEIIFLQKLSSERKKKIKLKIAIGLRWCETVGVIQGRFWCQYNWENNFSIPFHSTVDIFTQLHAHTHRRRCQRECVPYFASLT